MASATTALKIYFMTLLPGGVTYNRAVTDAAMEYITYVQTVISPNIRGGALSRFFKRVCISTGRNVGIGYGPVTAQSGRDQRTSD